MLGKQEAPHAVSPATRAQSASVVHVRSIRATANAAAISSAAAAARSSHVDGGAEELLVGHPTVKCPWLSKHAQYSATHGLLQPVQIAGASVHWYSSPPA